MRNDEAGILDKDKHKLKGEYVMGCPKCQTALKRVATKIVRCEGSDRHFFQERLHPSLDSDKEECKLIEIDKNTNKPTGNEYTVPCSELPDDNESDELDN